MLRFDGKNLSDGNYITDKKGKLRIDPKCAVGILLDFYKEHPSFGKNAFSFVFYRNALSSQNIAKKSLSFF